MAEHIERKAAVALIEERQKELCPVGRWSRHEVYGIDREKFDAWQEIIDALNSIPTVDAVVVTRCKDCMYYRQPSDCGRFEGLVESSPEAFCSYGEPREG